MNNGGDFMIGVDVGGTNVRIGLLDRDYRLTGFEMLSTANLRANGASFAQKMSEFLLAYLEKYKSSCNICGISAGFPSTIDKSRKRLLSTPNIPGMDQIDIVDFLYERLNIPVFIEKDVNMLMYHDLHYFNMSNKKIALGFYIGTGFGNSIYINGHILRGAHGVAGELGHIPMLGCNDVCNCGNIGCIENYASGKTLNAIQEKHFPNDAINRLFVLHAQHSAMKDFVNNLAIPIAAEINIFDPETIVLGGGILQMENFPVAELEAAIFRHARKPYPAVGLLVNYSPLVQENGVIGAGISGFKQLDKNRAELA